MIIRYKVRKMKRRPPRHNVSGDFGVWDSTYNRWVLNAEFLKEKEAKVIARVLNE